jgi:protein-L-isoaspartate(D-aspartate) O-methyltransferase
MSDSPEVLLAREEMIHEQIEARGIHDRRVLAALRRVPRERFVEVGSPADAYADRAMAIDCDQTISQPYIVALMTAALDLDGSEHVLEVGTGSGYQTAILAELAHDVVSIERHSPLYQQAGKTLSELGYTNVNLVVGDGTQGWASEAPYDRILVAAATDYLPPALFEQLAESGVLVIPLGDRYAQVLKRIQKIDGRPRSRDLTGCRFVPLVGEEKE